MERAPDEPLFEYPEVIWTVDFTTPGFEYPEPADPVESAD
jgi:hypothetical protein